MKRKRQAAIPLYDESRETLQSRPVRRRDPEQPSLPFDPMPDRVEPCLALLRPTPPEAPVQLSSSPQPSLMTSIRFSPAFMPSGKVTSHSPSQKSNCRASAGGPG